MKHMKQEKKEEKKEEEKVGEEEEGIIIIHVPCVLFLPWLSSACQQALSQSGHTAAANCLTVAASTRAARIDFPVVHSQNEGR